MVQIKKGDIFYCVKSNCLVRVHTIFKGKWLASVKPEGADKWNHITGEYDLANLRYAITSKMYLPYTKAVKILFSK